jgi:hypothetical protein
MMVLVCCVCRRIQRGREWIESAIPAGHLASHGYCPDCAAVARVELQLLQLRDIQDRLLHGGYEEAVA